MKASRHVWVIYFVGFDDVADDEESRVEPHVGKERIQTSSDPDRAYDEAQFAALCRGGQLIAISHDDENDAEGLRQAAEAEIMRKR